MNELPYDIHVVELERNPAHDDEPNGLIGVSPVASPSPSNTRVATWVSLLGVFENLFKLNVEI